MKVLDCTHTSKNSICCYICNKWHCLPCADIPDEAYAIVSKIYSMEYVCKACKGITVKSSNEIDDIKASLQEIKQHLSSRKPNLSYANVAKSYAPPTKNGQTVVLKNISSNLKLKTPVDFQKAIADEIGDFQISSVKKSAKGTVFVQVQNEEESNRLTSAWKENLLGKGSSAEKYKKAGSSETGLIKFVPTDISEAHILNDIKTLFPSITQVKRMISQGKILGSVILTFNDPHALEAAISQGVKIDKLFFPVYEFVNKRRPIRCYNCQKFGHVASNCKSQGICSECSETGHNFKNCTSKIKKCSNCKEAHSATDKSCPNFKQIFNELNEGSRFLA